MEYTIEELERAKEYLRSRLASERSISRDLLRLLEEYAGYILSALYRGASLEDIELLIDDLVSRLMEDVELLALDEHDKRDEILAYMLGERNGDTLEGRVDKRCHTFYEELYAVYEAGRILNVDYPTLLSSVKDSFKHPWDNKYIKEARDRVASGEVSSGVSFEPPHFGKGIEVSSFGALDTLLTYTIADSWTYWDYLEAVERGAKGYFVERGSSYPCDECQSHVGIFYPIGDEDNHPQYHAHCCCYIIYSYVDRE